MRAAVISREAIILIGICVADTALTVALLAMGLATEANPIMAHYVEQGFGIFCLVKLGTLVPAVLAAELYRRHNPEFVRRVLRSGIIAYLGIYFAALFAVNVL